MRGERFVSSRVCMRDDTWAAAPCVLSMGRGGGGVKGAAVLLRRNYLGLL